MSVSETRRALVTGVTGFVGRHLAERLLRAGWEVAGMARTESGGFGLSASFAVDVCDREAVAEIIATFQPTHVFHLAAALGGDDVSQLYAVNVGGTVSVCDAVRRHTPEARVLVGSSSAVYGAPETQPVTETHRFRPSTHYGASKAAQELAAMACARQGVPIVRVRPFNIIGPRQPASQVTSAIAAQVAAAERVGGGEVRVGTTSTRRDFVDVRDVAAAYLALATADIAADAEAVYNVCTGRSVSIADCVQMLTNLARVPVQVVQDPDRVRAVDVPEQTGSAARLQTATAWRPQINVEDSLVDLMTQARGDTAEKD